MTIVSDAHGAMAQIVFRVKTFDDGHGAVQLNGTWHAIPPTMTAVEYLNMVFASSFPAAITAIASGH